MNTAPLIIVAIIGIAVSIMIAGRERGREAMRNRDAETRRDEA